MHMAELHSLASLLLLSAAVAVAGSQATFRFASVYGDHMVLQQAPHMAVVWGYVPQCDKVMVTFNGKQLDATLLKVGTGDVCKWKTSLPATLGGSTPYTITAASGKSEVVAIKDVLFGDVWLCSGQSNMQFAVPQVYNASTEIAAASHYPMVRLFTAALQSSDTPVDELIAIEQNWTVATPESVGGKAWGYFSATCWFFGRDLYDSLKYPIGLIDTDWGGTPVEAWSSPDALAKCKSEIDHNTWGMKDKPTLIGRQSSSSKVKAGPNPHTPSVLWNAMIYPFLNMTIKGAIWYQGEANAGAPQSYHCTFPAMIDDWRVKWYSSTGQATDPKMPFGFVQLAPTGNNNISSTGFPDIRWAQTANFGYVPNQRLPNVFMAVAIDLGDPTSPFGSIHPRDKQDVGTRLSLAARGVVYGDTSMDYLGPIAKSAKLEPSTGSGLVKVSVTYEHRNPLELRYPYGFELGCVGASSEAADTWVEGTAKGVVSADSIAVEFVGCPASHKPKMVRYCWRTDPCTFKMCPVYSKDLPSPPFVLEL